MTQAQKEFEAMMRAKGYGELTKINNRYQSPSVQTLWNFFLLGWEMRGVQ